MHGERITGPTLRPSLEAIVRRFEHQLRGVTNLARLHAANAELTRLQKECDEHSPVVFEEKIRAAAHEYAKEPNKENLEQLRHMKSLSASDHVLVQEYGRQKCQAILAEIGPLRVPVCRKAAELLQETAEGVWKSDCAIYSGWSLTPFPSPLTNGLLSVNRELANVAKAERALDHIPELLLALLKLDAEAGAPVANP